MLVHTCVLARTHACTDANTITRAGDLPGAGTDADVVVEIAGERGSYGPHQLHAMKVCCPAVSVTRLWLLWTTPAACHEGVLSCCICHALMAPMDHTSCTP
eukprot:scaffold19976_cov23-Tisochrysis_lutea.AAC.1